MRYIKAIIFLIVVLLAMLLATDRVVRSVWSWHVFETYYATVSIRIVPVAAACFKKATAMSAWRTLPARR
jgi:hypothetical protein